MSALLQRWVQRVEGETEEQPCGARERLANSAHVKGARGGGEDGESEGGGGDGEAEGGGGDGESEGGGGDGEAEGGGGDGEMDGGGGDGESEGGGKKGGGWDGGGDGYSHTICSDAAQAPNETSSQR